MTLSERSDGFFLAMGESAMINALKRTFRNGIVEYVIILQKVNYKNGEKKYLL